MSITEHTVKTQRHTTFYLAAGPKDGPLVIFVHGWPELSISWRHQLPALAALGFRAIAPDMRGYGRFSVYNRHGDYAQQHIVRDMVVLDALGGEKAVWVGHDWGSPVVWNLASHHPDRCHAVANLCVPYYSLERGLDHTLALVDRDLYPADEFPAGQWDHMRYYEEGFAEAIAPMDANVYTFMKLLFRKGSPEGEGHERSPRPPAAIMVSLEVASFPIFHETTTSSLEEDLSIYVAALERNGFFGPSSWYMNHPTNTEYAKTEKQWRLPRYAGPLSGARYDYVCECTHSRLAEPMRTYCRHLTEETIRSGHWMAQEKPREVNAALVKWPATTVPGVWPQPK